MNGSDLEKLIKQQGLTYEQFVNELNMFCHKEVVNPKRAKQSVSEWIKGTYNMHPALDFAIERFFQERYPESRSRGEP